MIPDPFSSHKWIFLVLDTLSPLLHTVQKPETSLRLYSLDVYSHDFWTCELLDVLDIKRTQTLNNTVPRPHRLDFLWRYLSVKLGSVKYSLLNVNIFRSCRKINSRRLKSSVRDFPFRARDVKSNRYADRVIKSLKSAEREEKWWMVPFKCTCRRTF